MSSSATAETRSFDAEVHQLLKLMVNALYSNREIFLRELISNASDASDKLRFEALTDDALKGCDDDLGIRIEFDAAAGTLTIHDRGIGMNRDEVIDNLGTIARSGTRRFLEGLSGDQAKDAQLIGQFGVGFYSAFVVAKRIQVETRRANEPASAGVRWVSDGENEYQIEAIERTEQGTSITLSLSDEHKDLLDRWTLRRIIRHYSNHIAFPITLVELGKAAKEEDGEADASNEPVNESKALWARPKSEIKDEDYQAFYQSLSNDFQPPLKWAHHHVEGNQRYSLLLYLPAQAPFDLLINRDTAEGLKLYIQRVFIMDAAEQLVPRYLRFMRGVVDSADLPLNVSREILQDSPLLKKIRAAVVKRSLDLIEKVTEAGGESWRQFYDAFGGILKEGVIEDAEQRERIAGLLRFASTQTEGDDMTSLEDYISRMPEDQDTIWYLTGDSLKVAKNSPHLESFKARGIEVLLLTDRIDEWLTGHLQTYQGKSLKSVAKGQLDLGEAPEPSSDEAKLAERIKAALGDRVGEVRPSQRLTDSAACIVADEHGLSVQMQKLMRQAGQAVPESTPNLDINPKHPLIERVAAEADDARFATLAELILDQALLAEGGELADPASYVQRVNALLLDALGAAPTDVD
jgi:molecular chaperone HtpG